jgi:hypothetical protein
MCSTDIHEATARLGLASENYVRRLIRAGTLDARLVDGRYNGFLNRVRWFDPAGDIGARRARMVVTSDASEPAALVLHPSDARTPSKCRRGRPPRAP